MTARAQRIAQELFTIESGELIVNGNSISQLVKEFGSPLFVYDQSILARRLDELKTTFGSEVEVHYSMKANPNRDVVKFFIENAAGIEIASMGELTQATAAGCPAKDIIFAGPGKSETELRLAVEMGIGEIHVESFTELSRLENLGTQLNKQIPICVRINPSAEAQGGAMRMGGIAAPFGLDEERIPDFLKQVEKSPHIDFQGIHLFAGTQILDAQTLLNQYQRFVELATRVAEQIQAPLKSIDFGGGLGVPIFLREKTLDLNLLRKGFADLVSQIRATDWLKETRLVVEPGRFLTAQAGVYVTKITDIKSSRDKKFVIMNGGMHHHLAASGNLGQVIKKDFPIACPTKLNVYSDPAADEPVANCPTEEVDLVGPLCTPLDRLGRGTIMPELEIGDLIAVFCSGAYGLSASPVGFLSHSLPVEVFVDGDGSIRSSQMQLETRNGPA